MVLYFIPTVTLYVFVKKLRQFILLVLLPVPIAIVTASIFYYYRNDYELYKSIIKYLVLITVLIGGLVLLHTIFDFRKKKLFQLFIRLLASIILILNPLMINTPDYYWLMIGLYIVSGLLLGVYGYSAYYEGKKIGLLYIYVSVLFIIVVPVISLAIMKIYDRYIQDEIIYRGVVDLWVSCHLPVMPRESPGPTFLERKEVQYPLIFSIIYFGLVSIMASIRRYRIKRKIKHAGVIPSEFDDIINSKEDGNEEA